MNLTMPTAIILQAILEGSEHGFDIMDVTGLPSGTVYPALRRLEKEGYLDARWESEKTAREQQRPARRYYQVNPEGEALLAEARKRYKFLPKLATTRRSHA